MRLLLLSRGGSSRLFNHGDRIICIHCFKWFEITIPFRKCVAGMAQLSCEKIARGWTRTRDPMMPPETRPSLRPLHHNSSLFLHLSLFIFHQFPQIISFYSTFYFLFSFIRNRSEFFYVCDRNAFVV